VLVDDDAHAGTTLVSSPPIEDAGDGISHAMALVSSSSSSSPPVVSSIRMEVDDDVLLGTTPTKGVFRNDASSRLTDGCARLARFVCCNQKRIQISDVFSFSNDLL
jgi:hypothetical protein